MQGRSRRRRALRLRSRTHGRHGRAAHLASTRRALRALGDRSADLAGPRPHAGRTPAGKRPRFRSDGPGQRRPVRAVAHRAACGRGDPQRRHPPGSSGRRPDRFRARADGSARESGGGACSGGVAGTGRGGHRTRPRPSRSLRRSWSSRAASAPGSSAGRCRRRRRRESCPRAATRCSRDGGDGRPWGVATSGCPTSHPTIARGLGRGNDSAGQTGCPGGAPTDLQKKPQVSAMITAVLSLVR